jgi:hypothetical protein
VSKWELRGWFLILVSLGHWLAIGQKSATSETIGKVSDLTFAAAMVCFAMPPAVLKALETPAPGATEER